MSLQLRKSSVYFLTFRHSVQAASYSLSHKYGTVASICVISVQTVAPMFAKISGVIFARVVILSLIALNCNAVHHMIPVPVYCYFAL